MKKQSSFLLQISVICACTRLIISILYFYKDMKNKNFLYPRHLKNQDGFFIQLFPINQLYK